MNRRQFAKSAVSAAGLAWLNSWGSAFAAAEKSEAAGSVWPGWKPGEYQIHFIYTGVAESAFHIFPDGTTLLLDCGDHPACKRGKLAVPILPDQSRHSGEWIARYVERVNPRKTDVDYMMVSHFHDDHTGGSMWFAGRTQGRGEDYFLSGFGQAAETLTFHKAFDRGWPDYNEPIPLVCHELKNMKALYAWLTKKGNFSVEKFTVGAVDQVKLLHDAAKFADSFHIRNVCGNGKLVSGNGIRDLFAGCKEKKLDENALSIGMVIQYGPFKLFTAGDFAGGSPSINGGPHFDVENELGPQIGKVNVCKVDHHGYCSMSPGFVKNIQARVYVSCVWDQLHNLDFVMARLADRNLYPGDRLICPTMMPAERRAVDKDKPWMADVARPSYEGGHVVVNVAPGGKTYSVSYLTATDESMRIRAQFNFTA